MRSWISEIEEILPHLWIVSWSQLGGTSQDSLLNLLMSIQYHADVRPAL